MMDSNLDVINSVKAEFPLLFGVKSFISSSEFYEAYNAVAEYSIRATDPPFKPETHKHQWTLMGAAIGLIAMVLFKVGKIKVAEAVINVDRQVVIGYVLFVSALLMAFLLRAALDFKRASLARNKDGEKLSTLQDLVRMSVAVRNIQHYYWLEVFHQIGKRYDVYEEVIASTLPPLDIDTRVIHLDIESLKDTPELRSQIEKHEAFVKLIVNALDRDVARFKDKIETYDHAVQNAKVDAGMSDWRRNSHIRELFDRYLKSWFEVRSYLAGVALRVMLDERYMPEKQMLEAQLKLLTQARNIRQMYALSEILLPSTLALASIIYAARSVW